MFFLARFIMQSPTKAMLLCALLGAITLVVSPVGFFAGAAIALVTLVAGFQPGIKMLLVTTASGVAVSLLLGGLGGAGMALAEFWLPAFVLAVVFGKSRALSTTIEVAMVLSLVALLGAYLFLSPSPQVFWLEMMQNIVNETQAKGSYLEAEAVSFLTELLPPALTMLLTMGLMLVWVGMIMLARSWQTHLYPPVDFATEFRELALSRRIAIGAVGLFGLSFLLPQQTWVDEALGIVSIALTLQGLAVFHAWVSIKKAHKGWLILVYAMLALLPQMMVMIAMLGWVDNWIDWRSKMNAGFNS